jgi:hypothetical protein
MRSVRELVTLAVYGTKEMVKAITMRADDLQISCIERRQGYC